MYAWLQKMKEKTAESAMNKPIWQRKAYLNVTDTDWNFHVNQSIYARLIEDTLIEYNKNGKDELFLGKYFVSDYCVKFNDEMKVNHKWWHNNSNNEPSHCFINVYSYEFNPSNHTYDVYAEIVQNNTVSTQIEIVLSQT